MLPPKPRDALRLSRFAPYDCALTQARGVSHVITTSPGLRGATAMEPCGSGRGTLEVSAGAGQEMPMSMEPQIIGSLLDSLVASAVVVLSVLKEGVTTPQLLIANSDGMGWIEQAGLLRLAERICSEPPVDDEDPS